MITKKSGIVPSLILFGWLLFAGLLSAASSWVADPYRALAVKWPVHSIGGTGCTILLEPPWHDLKGVRELPFVRTSGVSLFSNPSYTGNAYFLRTIVLRELTGFGADGQAVPLKVRIESDEPDMLIQNPEYLTDGNPATAAVLSGNLADIKIRFLPMKCRIAFTAEKPVARIVLNSGGREGCRAATINGRITDQMSISPPRKDGTFTITSEALLYGKWRFSSKLQERMKKYPFIIKPGLRFAFRNVLGLHPENIDRKIWTDFENEYKDTFVGYELSEWDSNFFQTLIRPQSLRYGDVKPYIDFPCNRDGLVRNLKTYWDYHKMVFGPKVFGLSGQVLFPHYGAEWGGKIAGFELTQERSEHPHRNSLMFTRSAARQFNVPMLVYQAYYAINYTPDSRRKTRFSGIDYGTAPSISFRTYMTAYYMGNSFLDFEAQPWGQVKKNPDGSHSLTGNGKSIEKFYDWIHGPHGGRGSCYTPFLLLLDRKHGHDSWYRIGRTWKAWYNLAPLTDADYMTEYVMQSISPRFRRNQYDKPALPANLRNSALGDLFDVYLANPLTRGQVSLQQLEAYPLVMLVDDIAYTGKLIANLRNYVKRGGTLVMTAGHLKPFRKDFTGLTGSGRSRIRQDGLVLEQFQASGDTEILMKTSAGLPLVYSHPYGNGRVLTITSPFMKKTEDITMMPPQLMALLEKLQAKVCPVRVSGNIHFLYNLMDDGTWKVILLNNRGTAKAPGESHERFFPEYAASVQVSAPAGARAVERRLGASVSRTETNGRVVFSVTVPAGEVLVLDVQGVPPVKKNVFPDTVLEPPPADPPLPPDPVVPAVRQTAMQPSPKLIGVWKASEKYAGMKTAGVEFRNGRAVFAQPRNYAQVSFKAPYLPTRGSFEITALPEDLKAWRQGVVYIHNNLMLELRNGYWGIFHFSNRIFKFIQGPKAEKRLTHLKVTWDNFLIRFYVDGKEVQGEAGPLKFIDNPVKNTFYGNITVTLGSLSPTWPTTYAFRGELGDFILRGQ